MNIVEVTGGKVKEREIVEAAVYWSIKKLMPKLRTLDIEVKIKDIEEAMGYCSEGDTNREFELEIKKGMSLYDLISTVCHEMVHVKQYAKGELRYRASGVQQWKAKIISDKTEYMDLPWEKEAFKLERGLAIQCFEEISVSL
tara:strand:- start:2451 stop:2876 length:426 start_codon:yes stop_codon:yes gene_type:complete